MLFKSAYENIKHYINFYYFTQGNFFTGTLGEEFRYRIEADKEKTALVIYTYSGSCFEKAENKETQSFEFSEEGLDAAVKWIVSKNQEYLENGGK